MKKKNVILAMLVILGMVTFLDRINISVAGTEIIRDLNLTPEHPPSSPLAERLPVRCLTFWAPFSRGHVETPVVASRGRGP